MVSVLVFLLFFGRVGKGFFCVLAGGVEKKGGLAGRVGGKGAGGWVGVVGLQCSGQWYY